MSTICFVMVIYAVKIMFSPAGTITTFILKMCTNHKSSAKPVGSKATFSGDIKATIRASKNATRSLSVQVIIFNYSPNKKQFVFVLCFKAFISMKADIVFYTRQK